MRPVPPPVKLSAAFLLWACAACLAVGGCSAGAVDIAELNFKRMSPQGPLIIHVPVTEGWWWVDDDRVWVALHTKRGVFFSELNCERFDMSLVFEGLPAVRARDYGLGRESVRAYHRNGARHVRFASIHGLAGLWFEPGNVLRGRFRMTAKRQIFHILTGWSNTYQAVVFGEFRARRDRARGQAILLRTEEDGMERYFRPGTPPVDRTRPKRIKGPPVE